MKVGGFYYGLWDMAHTGWMIATKVIK